MADSTKSPPKQTEIRHYAAVWECIYCECTTCLSDEHIIPLSLGGVLILDKSSCETCRKETGKFEQVIARTMYGAMRTRFRVATRRPRQRPKSFEIGIIDKQGRHRYIKIPPEEYHASAYMFKMKKPKILLGLPPYANNLDWTACILSAAPDDMDRLVKKYGWDRMFSLKSTINEFCRLLAKIAHSYAIAELGYRSFKPFLLDIILGKTESCGYYIGGKYDKITSTTDDLEETS